MVRMANMTNYNDDLSVLAAKSRPRGTDIVNIINHAGKFVQGIVK